MFDLLPPIKAFFADITLLYNLINGEWTIDIALFFASLLLKSFNVSWQNVINF